jgi:hypothetical protein
MAGLSSFLWPWRRVFGRLSSFTFLLYWLSTLNSNILLFVQCNCVLTCRYVLGVIVKLLTLLSVWKGSQYMDFGYIIRTKCTFSIRVLLFNSLFVSTLVPCIQTLPREMRLPLNKHQRWDSRYQWVMVRGPSVVVPSPMTVSFSDLSRTSLDASTASEPNAQKTSAMRGSVSASAPITPRETAAADSIVPLPRHPPRPAAHPSSQRTCCTLLPVLL